ncbi:MAG: hypothetical protein J7F05_06740 [Trichodesmium erythraeum GBRTRLIN201]|nr:hypothetical protein [Trichodesmium erythraeum GBRTRLIN201]
MENIHIFLATAVGVAVSVCLPLVKELLPKPKKVKGHERDEGIIIILWGAIKPYLSIGVFSLFVALIVVAFLQETLTSMSEGFLAGYTADSTFQRLSHQNTEN